jgi:outer membrane protein assembly factor BamB
MSDTVSDIRPAPLPPQPDSSADADSTRPFRDVRRRLRLWPGVVILALQWLAIAGPGWVAPGTMIQFMGIFWGPMVGAAALAAWWLFASRLSWVDRGLGLLACGAAGAAALLLGHPSINALVLTVFALPVVTTAWVLWLVITPFLSWPVRRAGLLVVFLLAWGYFTLVRFQGIDGSATASFEYRWLPSAEEKFLAKLDAGASEGEPAADAAPVALQTGDWPGFRGPDRDGKLTGVRVPTDWKEHPPKLAWRHEVGPGWSSFAVAGTRLFTQEQWGEEEAVVCYDADSGTRLWAHKDAARFTEMVAGPGPRATPTVHDGKVYALGAAGRLNCLDAATGRVLWSRDIVEDSGAKVPQWGFASSPLVAQGVVTVFAGGPDGKSVLGYHAASGEPAWYAGEGQFSYCSPQLARIGGVEQILIATDAGLTAFDPARGTVLWQHGWPMDSGQARIVQPALLGNSDVLIGSGFGIGTRRVHVGRDGDAWAAQEVWTTRAIKPYYNDLVAHQGHLYGFDANFFTCVSLEDGKGKWRARGYGNGQVLLLAEQGLLLVLSEKGEVALVEASPDGHKELGRFQAIEGKTWNHPVIAHGKVFVRNGEEAACYQLEK